MSVNETAGFLPSRGLQSSEVHVYPRIPPRQSEISALQEKSKKLCEETLGV